MDVLTSMVEYFGTPEIEGNDLNLHIAISSMPATPLATDYAVTELSSNCNEKEVILACTDYPFICMASVKEEEEEREEAMRNITLAEESEERPEGKRCKIDVSQTVATSGAV